MKANELFILKEYNHAQLYYVRAIQVDSTIDNDWLIKGNALFE